MALRSTIVDGDVCFLLLESGSLEAVEAHRLRTPHATKRNVVHGVLLNEHRERLEFWFTRDNIPPHQQVQRVGDMRAYPTWIDGRRRVLQVYNPRRFSQTRGITHLAPIRITAGMHDDLQFANLVRAQVAACFAIFHERESDFSTTETPQRGEQETETLSDGSTRTIEGIAPGMEIYGAPGDKLQGFAPNIPNPEFFPHAKLVLTFIAINLDLPVQVLLLDPSETNFSGWRGAMDQAKMGFRDIQRFMIDLFYRPVYQWKVQQWIEERGSKLKPFAKRKGINLLSHRWKPPSWPYIEPWKDTNADAVQEQRNLNSPRRIQAKCGRDWDEVCLEIVEDREKLIRIAIERAEAINGDFPQSQVDWRELASMTAKKQDRKNERPSSGTQRSAT